MALPIYSFGIRLYGLLIRLVAPFNPKAKKWLSGRKDIWLKINSINNQRDSPVWIHVSSLGEFEQGRPVIEQIKRAFPNTPVVLTFFSPSGYEMRVNYQHADNIYYLPLDTRKNAERFINAVNPRLAIFVKYDFWFNYLNILSARKIPFIFISSVFHSRHFLFRWWAIKLRRILQNAEVIFVQDQKSEVLLSKYQFNTLIAGDNRIDRVIQLQSELKEYVFLNGPKIKNKIMIFGSIWPNDVSIFAPWLNQSTNPYFIILAPHDISQGMRKKITSHIGKEYKLLSECHDQTQPEDGIMVDTIGDLAHLYQYGHIAYIGGGFGKGIHSILEPVAAGLPVIFGPNYHRFQEAKELIHLGAAISIKSSHEFKEAMEFFSNEDHYRAAKQGIASFLSHHQGATLKVVQYLANRKYIS